MFLLHVQLNFGDHKSMVGSASMAGSALSRLSQKEEIMATLGISARRDQLEILVQVFCRHSSLSIHRKPYRSSLWQFLC